jgi:phosphatidylglycerophosphatase GEP4
MNISGLINSFRVFYNPALFVPNLTVSKFHQIPLPIPAFKGKPISLIILDKDNCFAEPHGNIVYPEYQPFWAKLKSEYPGNKLLIVSNTAGSEQDIGNRQARLLENNTGVKVFRHSIKKPGCHVEIVEYAKSLGIKDPGQIVVIGDRLMTDIVMANLMGASSIWVRDGVVEARGPLTAIEKMFYDRVGHKWVKKETPE